VRPLFGPGGVLNVARSAIQGDVNGIEISDAPFFGIQTLGPNTVTLTNHSTLTNSAGDNGEAAFKVEGAVANISVTNSTVDSGVGAIQHILLDATQSVQSLARKPPENVTPAVTQTENRPSVVDLTADNSILNGDILSDSVSTTTGHLEHNTVLNGRLMRIISQAQLVLIRPNQLSTCRRRRLISQSMVPAPGTCEQAPP